MRDDTRRTVRHRKMFDLLYTDAQASAVAIRAAARRDDGGADKGGADESGAGVHLFQALALQSFQLPGSWSPVGRNPRATTNFSELSARLAGGLKFDTVLNRCFSSF